MEDTILEETNKGYISARHLPQELGVSAATARAWRYFENIRAKKIGATWYYSRRDLLKLTAERNTRVYQIMIDGKPIDHRRRRVRTAVSDAVLKEALGDYLSGKDLNKIGIDDSTLQVWRDTGRVRAKSIKNVWYYSRQDLLPLIRTESRKALKSK